MFCPLKQLHSAVFAALMFCFTLTASGAEIDLFSLLPSYSAVAGYADCTALARDDFFRQYTVAGIKKAAFGCDERGRRTVLLLHYADEKSWQEMWEQLSPHLEPLPAERRILLFKLKENSGFFRRGYFAVLAPMVAGFYTDVSQNQPFRCDYAGIPDRVRQALPAETRLGAAGFPRLKDEAFRQIRSFKLFLHSRNGRNSLRGQALCRKPFHASLTHFALLASCSMYLQHYCQLSPEDANEIISRIKVKQNGSELCFEFDDFALLLQKIRNTVKF